MEEAEMTIRIIGLVIGLLVLAAGLYYLVHEKSDPESRKIYGVISAVGAVLSLAMLLKIIFAA